MRAHLRHEQDFCQGCPLFRDKRHRTTYVPTDVIYDRVGKDGETPEVDVLFVGEAPGRTEDQVGYPFAGDSGVELRTALSNAGISGSYAIGNTVRCRPVDDSGNNRPPTVEEVAACSNYIRKDIEQLNPKIVVLVGNQAVQALTTNPEWKGKKINSLKGQISYEKNGRIHLATLHPSAYLRSNNGPEKRRFFRHIKSVHRLLTGEETKWSRKGKVVLLDTLEKVDKAIDYFMNECESPVAVDSEALNLNRIAKNKLATLQLCADSDLAYVFPFDHWDSPFKTKEEKRHVKRALQKLFTSKKVKFPFWIMHNAQFDIAILLKHLRIIELGKPAIDTQFLAYLQDENQAGDSDTAVKGKRDFNAFRLKDLAREHLGFYLYDTELSDAMAARHGANGGSLWDLSLDRLSEYGGVDAYVTFRLFHFYRRWLDRQDYKTALRFALRWYGRIAPLLAKMSMNGFAVDQEQLAFLQSDESPILSRLDEIPREIYASPEAKRANDILLGEDSRTKGMKPLFGRKPWVLDVDKRIHRIHLFVDSCKLTPLDEGKDGLASLNKGYWEEYKEHELIKLYQEYSGLYKLRTSYLDSIGNILFSKPDNAADGRIHAGFHAIRTVTGRLSSSDPNLQQLPKGDPWSAKAFIRSMYGARPGHVLVECDYGQAEVRWWAQIAGDQQYAKLFSEMKALREEYQRTGDADLGKRVKLECDIHKKVASLMFRLELAGVTKDIRQKAKALCFGSIYGQHYKTLAAILGIEPEEALALQETFVKEFPKAGAWLTDIEKQAMMTGLVSTPMGRLRHLSDLFTLDEGAGRRRARNSPIQAVSSDTTALAAWRIQNWIEENGKPYQIINCVHDAITLEVPLDYEMVQESIWLFKEMMVDTIPAFLKKEFDIDMIVPMEIDYDLGVRWGHMLGYDGVKSKLAGLVDQCGRWDTELQAGTAWNQIARREACFQKPVEEPKAIAA